MIKDEVAPTDAESAYSCDCGTEMKFQGNEAPSRCLHCGRDVDVRKIKKLSPVPGNLWPTYGADAPAGPAAPAGDAV